MKINFTIEISPEEIISALNIQSRSEHEYEQFQNKLIDLENTFKKLQELTSKGRVNNITLIPEKEIVAEILPKKRKYTRKNKDVVAPVKTNVLKGKPAATKEKICEWCNIVYKPTSNAQHFCSENCKKFAKESSSEPRSANEPKSDLKKEVASDPEPSPKIKPSKKKVVNQINFELAKSKKCLNCQKKFKPIAETQVCCSTACCNELAYSKEIPEQLAGNVDAIVDKAPDPSKSFYQQKLDRQRIEKEQAELIESLKAHPKIDHEKIKKNKQFQYSDTSL